MATRLSVITVTYNSQRFLDGMFDSLVKFLPKYSEWIVVDHESKDSTVEKLKGYQKTARFPIKIIEQKNLGFSKGNNRAAKDAQGEYILILNPDTRLIDHSIESMLDFIAERGDIGILAPRLLEPDGKVQQSVRRLPTLSGLISESLLNKKHAFSEYAPGNGHPTEVECVYGAAMLLQKHVFESVKGFTEDYFLYYEDIDFCRKILRQGLKIVYFPEAQISHQVGGSVVESKNMPPGIRTLAHFIPIKASGKQYFQLKGRYLYHGVLIGVLIAILQYVFSIHRRIAFYSKKILRFG